MANFIWGANGAQLTPDQVARLRAQADAMRQDGGLTTPVASPFAGINRALEGYLSRRNNIRGDASETAGLAGADARIASLLGGGGGLTTGGGSMSAPPMDAAPLHGPAGSPAKDQFSATLLAGGLPQHVVDGINMNLADESGFNPSAVGDHGNAFGLAQWNGPRKAALMQFAQSQGANPADPTVQAKFLLTELNGPEAGAGAALAQAKNPQDAAVAFLNNYERPAEQFRSQREASYRGGSPVSTSVSTMGGPSGGTGGTDIASLLALSADPWVAKKYGGIVNALMGQQVDHQNAQFTASLDRQNAQFSAGLNRDNAQYSAQLAQQDPRYQMQLQSGQLALDQATGAAPATSLVELEARAKVAGLVPGTPEYKRFITLGGSMTGQGFGTTVIMGRDANGNVVPMQASPTGGMIASVLPPGVTMMGPTDKAYGTAIGAAAGTAAGAVATSANSLASKMPGLEGVVSEMDKLANDATYTTTGRLWNNIVSETGNGPTAGALARTKYIAMANNQILPLLRDTFGAQFTEQEGQRLMATMGDPNLTPVEKQAALTAFIEQKKNDLAALQDQSAMPAPSDTAVPPTILRSAPSMPSPATVMHFDTQGNLIP